MYVKNDTTYAEAGCYLIKKNASEISFQSIGKKDEFNEVKFSLPLKISIIDDIIFLESVAIKVESFSKKHIKTHIIKMRYSNDDQIAIILNKDESEKDKISYNRMQMWRRFADDLAIRTVEQLNK
jgi:hypothetical protein